MLVPLGSTSNSIPTQKTNGDEQQHQMFNTSTSKCLCSPSQRKNTLLTFFFLKKALQSPGISYHERKKETSKCLNLLLCPLTIQNIHRIALYVQLRHLSLFASAQRCATEIYSGQPSLLQITRIVWSKRMRILCMHMCGTCVHCIAYICVAVFFLF